MRKQAPKIEMPKKSRSWVNESHRNPNAKVLQEKKQSVICDLDAGDGIHTEYTEAGVVVFDQGTAVLPDDSRANEMVAELKSRKGNHRDRYAYIRHREGMRRDPTHNYTFGYGHISEDRWNDIFGKKEEDDRENTAG